MRAKEYGGTGPWTGLFRHELDLETGKASRYRLSDRGCEFPTINPKHVGTNYNYGYAAASANEGSWFQPLTGIVKVDVSNKGNDKVWLPDEG